MVKACSVRANHRQPELHTNLKKTEWKGMRCMMGFVLVSSPSVPLIKQKHSKPTDIVVLEKIVSILWRNEIVQLVSALLPIHKISHQSVQLEITWKRTKILLL